MKDYVNSEGLLHFLEKITEKFSNLNLMMVATDDDNGNVVLDCSATSSSAISNKVIALEEEIAVVKSTLDNNDYLVVNDTSN